jgi:hypothetical protein
VFAGPRLRDAAPDFRGAKSASGSDRARREHRDEAKAEADSSDAIYVALLPSADASGDARPAYQDELARQPMLCL